MEINTLVEKYIQLRDKKAEMKAAYTAKVERIDAALKQIEGVLLHTFNETGMESVRTANGTAYKTTTVSAKVSDWEPCLTYIRQHDAWELLEHRVGKKAVEEFMADKGMPPPGVSVVTDISINVRRT
jgi:hypothetical protein